MNKNNSPNDFSNMANELLSSLSLNLPLAQGRAHIKMLANRLNGNTQSCLDVGCGRGRFELLKQFYSVGCDIHQPTLLKAKERGYYDKLVRCDAKQLPFKPKSFDAVISMEVIEHLHKPEGLELLKQMEGIARKQVIVTTPWGYAPEGNTRGNPHNVHLTGWLPQEFQELGYKTRPFYCFRFPRSPKVAAIIIKHIFTVLLYPLIRLFPDRFAADFVAIKEIG